MSHYARLKVTQDAPVEVIRAAYRVLAAKYHPDRQAAVGTADDDAANAEMAALNTAYQVLVHPDRRREYDALLAEKTALRKARVTTKTKAKASTAPTPAVEPEPINARVDMEWLPPKATDDEMSFYRSRRAMVMGGAVTCVVLVGGSFWISSLVVQHQMEKALSAQYAVSPATVMSSESVQTPTHVRQVVPNVDPVAASAGGSPPRHVPSLTELSKLSNEELIQLLPELEGQSLPKRRSPVHPLDGKPLNLRQDGQAIDSVAPDSTR